MVYLGHDSSLDRPVAIKFIAAREPDARARERFLREARTIARLRHENVVTAYRIGEVEGRPYLVSEYVPGRSLDELPLPRPWQEVRTMGLQLARGLAAVHRQGILHRDIKPSNILLDEEGDIKLVDFGLAQLVDTPSAGGDEGRVIAGTLPYMAPEIFRGEPASFCTDIYSLGAVLYQLCTGDDPRRLWPSEMRADSESMGGESTLHLSPVAGLREIPGIDPELTALIARCLRYEPVERPASGEVLRDALERITPLRRALAPSVGNPYRGLQPFEAEHRALFFGREAELRALLGELRRKPLVLVAGDSGVGKSSLCRAGLLPAVKEGLLDGNRSFECLAVVPGRRPLLALAAAAAPLLGREEKELAEQAGKDPWLLGRSLREHCRGTKGVLFFVDQLEELLTTSDAQEAALCAEILADLAQPTPGLRLIVAIRGDFLTRLGALPGLGDEILRALYLVRPLTLEGIREAIVGPARSQGVIFESDELIQRLVASVDSATGGLPLLEFALTELWEARDQERSQITSAVLTAIGGVAGALSRHADRVLASLQPAQRQAARRILLQLVTAEGTRIRRSEEELGIGDGDARAALAVLIHGRLLFVSRERDAVVHELAHEALIEHWGTLREWRDTDVGQRAIRQRLEEAARGWERLGKAREGLWGKRQLAEAEVLDIEQLGPRERRFFLASRRAVQWQRYSRLAAVLALCILAVAIYGTAYVKRRYETLTIIHSMLNDAEKWLVGAKSQQEMARQRRVAALALYDAQSPPPRTASGEPGSGWEAGEEEWSRALEAFRQAKAGYAQAEASLQAALLRDNSNLEVRARLSELLYESILLGEQFPGEVRTAEIEQRLSVLDPGGVWRARLQTSARLRITTEPPGARVTLGRYVIDEHGYRRLVAESALGATTTTPITDLELPPGSYLLTFAVPGRPAVRYPIVLERGETRSPLVVPIPASPPAGYVYVPPGCFLFGEGDYEPLRKFMHSPPIHRVCIGEGYWIGRTEVMFQDWIDYLEHLEPAAAARHILETPHRELGFGAVRLRRVGGQWEFTFWRGDEDMPLLAGRVGEKVRYPKRPRNAEQDWRRFPLLGVSLEDFEGYLAWLDRSGRLPGARLCTEYEWERAARGADDRRYPHGERVASDDVNYDNSYGRREKNYGPDEVGLHPDSTSPFGLLDMSGNAWEMVRPLPIEPSVDVGIRGGAYYYDEGVVRTTVRQVSTKTLRKCHDRFSYLRPRAGA